MPRLVEHVRNNPYPLKKDEMARDTAWICACGLSQNKPFCDGSHKRTRDEDADALYIYDDEGRIRVRNMY